MKTTKQTDRAKAMAVAIELERLSRSARQGTATAAQARKLVSEIIEKTSGEALEFFTVATWLSEWMAGKTLTRAEGTRERYQHVIDEFIKYLGKRAALSLTQLTPKDLSGFRNSELGKGKAAKTCNLAVKIIGAALNAARRQGYITSNPAEALEALPYTAATKGTFSPEEIASILEAAPSKDWHGAILLGCFTGARLQDVANMRWDAVDFTAKAIRFTPQKTKKHPLTIPLHPQLEGELLSLAGQDEAATFIFPTLAGRQTGGAHGLSQTFSKIMQKAGIGSDAARPKAKGGRAISRLSFHSLRHGFNSGMANAGVSQEMRMKLTGHASAEINTGYTHLQMEPLRAAVNAVPAIPKTKSKPSGNGGGK